jgi:hypothetical protein
MLLLKYKRQAPRQSDGGFGLNELEVAPEAKPVISLKPPRNATSGCAEFVAHLRLFGYVHLKYE